MSKDKTSRQSKDTEDEEVVFTPDELVDEASPQDSSDEEQFAQERDAKAASQGLGAGGVAETRPQSFLTRSGPPHSALTQKLKDEGDPHVSSDEPMGKEAYDRANSDAQKQKAAKNSKQEGIMVGNVVRATQGPHEGRIVAVTRIVSRRSIEDVVKNAAGDPAQLYTQPKEIEGRALRDARDGEVLVLDVDDAGLEKLNEDYLFARR